MTTFKSGICIEITVESRARLAHNAGVDNQVTPSRSYPIAVIMERLVLANRWGSVQWQAKGVLPDTGEPGAPPRVIVERQNLTQVIFPGYRLTLARDEAEGYYLNLTSPQPKIFVLWREHEALARPERLTVSYGEGTRWADSGEQVDGVPVPGDLLPWIARFVEAHYRPEPPKPRRYASSRDRGRMGNVG